MDPLLKLWTIMVMVMVPGPAMSGGSVVDRSTQVSTDETPQDEALPSETGIASYYARHFHGRRTASGERYDAGDLTAAHRRLPFGTRVRVTHLGNDRQVVVRVNDRGPYRRGRVLDLSRRAARELGLVRTGTARVRLEVLEREP